MKISGIICEYNPFHNGHMHHINLTKSATNSDGIVGIMSGNFAQRGIPTLIDKWTRTRMALEGGVDLVIELPAIFALSSAEFFAKGSVELLDSLGVVDYLSFGSEIGDLKDLKLIAEILCEEPPKFKSLLKDYLAKGLPFAKSRSLALKDYLDIQDSSKDLELIMSSPNNVLAIEYCKALIKLNSSIIPFTIKRQGNNYNDKVLKDGFASASALRNFLGSSKDLSMIKKYLPDSTLAIMEALKAEGYPFVFPEDMFPFIKYRLLTNSNSLWKIPEASEGLDRKILKEITHCTSLDELISNVKSKRYTYTRISRILCQYFLNFDSYDIASLRNSKPSYARILGFNSTGAAILKKIKASENICPLTKASKLQNPMISLDINATKAYSMINSALSPVEDFIKSPVLLYK